MTFGIAGSHFVTSSIGDSIPEASYVSIGMQPRTSWTQILQQLEDLSFAAILKKNDVHCKTLICTTH